LQILQLKSCHLSSSRCRVRFSRYGLADPETTETTKLDRINLEGNTMHWDAVREWMTFLTSQPLNDKGLWTEGRITKEKKSNKVMVYGWECPDMPKVSIEYWEASQFPQEMYDG
jgi:hypothetical protein